MASIIEYTVRECDVLDSTSFTEGAEVSFMDGGDGDAMGVA